MPVNQKIMRKLKAQYGEKKGESVYYALEQKGKIKPKKARKKK